MPEATAEKLLAGWQQHWGVTSEILDLTAPSVANDPRFRSWWLRYSRLAMPRRASATMYRWVTEIDIRSILPSIRVPTLVVHRAGNRHHRVAFGRYLADHIPDAKYVELPGADSFPFHAGDFTPVLDEVEEFLTGTRASPLLDRRLATMLFTDVVGSTRIAAERGDSAWIRLARSHDEIVREHFNAYRGREVDHTGDGFLAIFDGPARAVTCAARMVEALRELGVTIRVGLHTGEVELVGQAVRGLAVHIAARVMSAAEEGGILVSSIVKDLVLGSGIEFDDRGAHRLKGVPGEWQLFEVVSTP
jgi:class 3 adenylate cyclase